MANLARGRFFDSVRTKPFGGTLSQDQVSGMEAILAEWEKRGLTDVRHLAYMLATTYHETARTMRPIKEYGDRAYFMRMYDKSGARPKVAAELGNVVVGDGAIFCGRGFVQLTGRRNYKKASDKLGVDFVSNPALVMRPDYAAAIMFDGMIEGWFTGRKLSDYFGAKSYWTNARRIINGTDKAALIADYALEFYAALKASETDAPYIPPPPDIPAPEPVPQPASGGFFLGLIRAIWRALKGA